MSFAIRSAWAGDLDGLVALAAECQADPNRCCNYLSRNGEALRTEITTIGGVDDWTAATWVALDDERELIGWLAADHDPEMGRIWWRGPFVAEVGPALIDPVLDALFSTGRAAYAAVTEHELVADDRSAMLERFVARHGFLADEASVALWLDPVDVDVPEVDAVVRPAGPDEAAAIALHDSLFPGTHTSGRRLFGAVDDDHHRWVAESDGALVGYVATERHPDDSLYVDFVGVAPAWRGRGIGRALVATAIAARPAEITHVHLTVRSSNAAARALYASMGFVDDVVLVPHRLGFTLG